MWRPTTGFVLRFNRNARLFFFFVLHNNYPCSNYSVIDCQNNIMKIANQSNALANYLLFDEHFCFEFNYSNIPALYIQVNQINTYCKLDGIEIINRAWIFDDHSIKFVYFQFICSRLVKYMQGTRRLLPDKQMIYVTWQDSSVNPTVLVWSIGERAQSMKHPEVVKWQVVHVTRSILQRNTLSLKIRFDWKDNLAKFMLIMLK